MYCLLLQVLAMAAATHAALHSQHKRDASCQIYPTSYDYQDATSQNNSENCNLHDDDTNAQYMDCTTPALLTDGQYGPDNYSSTEYYYIAQGGSHQILFTFPDIPTVKDIKLYYYSNVTGNKSLPRVSVYIVNDDFNVWDSPTKSWIVDVDPSNSESSTAGLKQERITVNIASRKWLLRFYQLEHQFYLSEVAFFSCPQDPPTTVPPLEITTEVQTMAKSMTTSITTSISTTDTSISSDTQPEPSTHTSTDITSTTESDDASNDEQLSQQSDFLPWVLTGIMTMLFCTLLTVNIICCIVCVMKKHRKRRYMLKRNPSYICSPRALGARNFGFENHIYDVPAT